MELDKAMNALGQFGMIINPCSHWSLFLFTINYIFICLQTKQCCNDTGMRDSLLWGLVQFCFGLVQTGFSLHLPGCVFTVFYENNNCFLCKHFSLQHCPWSLELTVNLYESHSHPPGTCLWLCVERKTIHRCTK